MHRCQAFVISRQVAPESCTAGFDKVRLRVFVCVVCVRNA